MKAVGFDQPGPLDGEGALRDIELPRPSCTEKDLLVRIKSVSVNPVDAKVRNRPLETPGIPKVLGYDASGVVEEIGKDVESFKVGDEVFYAGALNRSGTNCEYHLVDERIVGRKPSSLDFSAAAALPLTSITAWEMLFSRLDINSPPPQGGDAILIIGGAGGVGSMAIQLLRAMTQLKIIATASRPESESWVRELGAHHVLNHTQPLSPQIEKLGITPGFVFSISQTDQHFTDIVDLLAPQGRFGLIDDPSELDARPLKLKSLSLHWELMFTRSLFSTPDMSKQGELLNEISSLIDQGKIKSTLAEVLGPIDAKHLTLAHRQIETGSTKGKIVLSSFS